MNDIVYEWDDGKAAANLAKHDVPMDRVHGFEWDGAIVMEDTRRDYGEPRLVALGHIGGRLHVLTFTPRGEAVRVIGLRKANSRERRDYDDKKA